MAETLHLITAEGCPFCHRVLLVLAEKNIEAEIEMVDLEHKAGFLDRLSPHERVPVLHHGDKRIFESSIIAEYLEEVFPEPPLLPADPGERAACRFWIDFADSRFMPAYYNLLKAPPGNDRDYWHNRLLGHLGTLEAGPLAGRRPYMMGASLTLADIAFFPFFERFASVEEYRGVVVPGSMTGLAGWLDTMAQRPAVAALALSRSHYVDYFRPYYAD